jgi:hypothetical protein
LTTDEFSLSGYGDLLVTVNEARADNPHLYNVGVYLARHDDSRLKGMDIHDQLKDGYGDDFIGVIPDSAVIAETTYIGRPISFYILGEGGRSRRAYDALVKKIKSRIAAAERQG